MFRRVFIATNNQKKKGFGVDDRWPYPISQTMQRQTGSRVKPLLVPGTPPIVPASHKGNKDGSKEDNSAEPSHAGEVAQHSKD